MGFIGHYLAARLWHLPRLLFTFSFSAYTESTDQSTIHIAIDAVAMTTSVHFAYTCHHVLKLEEELVPTWLIKEFVGGVEYDPNTWQGVTHDYGHTLTNTDRLAESSPGSPRSPLLWIGGLLRKLSSCLCRYCSIPFLRSDAFVSVRVCKILVRLSLGAGF